MTDSTEEVIQTDEAEKTKVSSDGTKRKVKVCPVGFKAVGGKCVHISSDEKQNRKKGAKKGAKTKKGKGPSFAAKIVKKSLKAKNKRKAQGIKDKQ